MICVLPQSSDLQLQLAINTNGFELQATMLGFQLHAEKSIDSRVIVSTENKTAFSELWSQRLQSSVNQPLRLIILVATVKDILIEAS